MWPPKTDGDLARDVRDAPLRDPSVESADVTVDANDDVVTLSGAVPSYAMRAAAGADARHARANRAPVARSGTRH